MDAIEKELRESHRALRIVTHTFDVANGRVKKALKDATEAGMLASDVWRIKDEDRIALSLERMGALPKPTPSDAPILADIESIAKRLVPGCEHVAWFSPVILDRGVARRHIHVSALDAETRVIETWSVALKNADVIEALTSVRRMMAKEERL